MSFGSAEKPQNTREISYKEHENETNPSNCSKISGVSPFFSAEDISTSFMSESRNKKGSSSSYDTAENSSTTSSKFLTASTNEIRIHIDSDSEKENSSKNIKCISNLRYSEDSGISSRKSDASNNHNEISADFANSWRGNHLNECNGEH